MQRTPEFTAPPLGIQRLGDGLSIGVELDHRVDPRAPTVQLLNPLEVELHDPLRGPASTPHPVLELGDGDFLQLEGGDGGRLWTRARSSGGGDQHRSQRRCHSTHHTGLEKLSAPHLASWSLVPGLRSLGCSTRASTCARVSIANGLASSSSTSSPAPSSAGTLV